MSRQALETLMDRWSNESGFREQMRRDPRETVRLMGVELSAEEAAAFNNIDWNLSDEELQTRITKYGS